MWPFGFHSKAMLDVVFGLSNKRLRQCADLLETALPDAESEPKPDPLDVFNFLASSGLRGDSGCSQLPCQIGKLQTLSRFAALYADRVVFPVDFLIFDPADPDDRFRFFRSVNALNYLRPLIEADIIQLAPASTCVCKACLLEQGVDLKRIESGAGSFWRQNADRFSVIYRPPAGHEPPKLDVSGPPGFLPHGGLEIDLPEPLEYVAKRTRLIDGYPGVIVPGRKVAERNLLSEIVFSAFETDLIAQQIYGVQFGATYLTDSPGEAEFFGGLKTRDEAIANAARFCGHLAHTVPLLSDVPIRKVLQIRAQEPEAFIRYRSALNDIVREHIRPGIFLGADEASELYHDVLRPRIAKLKSEATARERSSRRKAAAKVVCSFAAVTLGVVNGLLPAELAKLFLAVGGVSLLKDIGEALADIQRKPSEVRNNDLYFLLDLEAGMRSHE